MSFDDPEHEFSLRYAAAEAVNAIAPLIIKSVVEATPCVAPVCSHLT